MTCFLARRRFSAYRDGDLSGAQARALAAHLAECGRCAARWNSYSSALDELAAAPRLVSPEGIAARLLTRLEVESRGPGLALLFRSVWVARPLIWPSLVPAAFLVAAVVTGAVLL